MGDAKRAQLCLLGLLFLLPSLSWGAADDDSGNSYFFRIVHVTPNGKGDGTSWEEATSLRAAC